VRTILIADVVMSVDNVIAVAAAAKGSTALLVIGLAISIPLVIFGSTLMIKLMERFPIIVVLGAALIGWVGGETIVSDNVLKDTLAANPWLHYAGAVAGAAFVILVGRMMQARARKASA
jgi:predicted tellurium resistance membrane protein TerC